MKLNFAKYQFLPDSMRSDILKGHILEFLESVQEPNIDVQEAFEGLMELADRQWHTYEMLDPAIKRRLEDWVIKVWQPDSRERIEYLTSIIAYLGLSKAYRKVTESVDDIIDPNLKKEIQNWMEELNGSIDDPYFGMR